MEKTNIKTYDENQIKDARQFCGILQTVSLERRNIFITIANAYMDGMAAGEAIASGKAK